MEHRVLELVEFASAIMTLNSGDLIAGGTNHEGLGALQDGESVEIEVERVGCGQLDPRCVSFGKVEDIGRFLAEIPSRPIENFSERRGGSRREEEGAIDRRHARDMAYDSSGARRSKTRRCRWTFSMLRKPGSLSY